jgi:hypothetical protein
MSNKSISIMYTRANRQRVPIENMATPHLVNALKRRARMIFIRNAKAQTAAFLFDEEPRCYFGADMLATDRIYGQLFTELVKRDIDGIERARLKFELDKIHGMFLDNLTEVKVLLSIREREVELLRLKKQSEMLKSEIRDLRKKGKKA